MKENTIQMPLTTIRRIINEGTIQGAVAWTVYAIVECGFSSILRWVITPGYEYVPLHWGFTILLFGFYPVIGLILGALAGLCFYTAAGRISHLQKVNSTIFIPAFAAFTVVLAYDINFIANYSGSLGLSELPPLFISILLIFALVVSMGSSTWFSRLRFLANPWTASIVLIGLPWINGEILSNSSLVLKAATALVYPVVVFMISLFIQKIGQTSRLNESMASMPGISIRPLLLLAPVVLVVFGISLFLKQEPLVIQHKFKSAGVATNRPNVLLIVMDTVRADHLSLYGYERDTTPNLREFAKEGTLYIHSIASGDMTLSTHASIFTGMNVRQHKAHFDPFRGAPNGRPLAYKFDTLAEILSNKGFLTMGVVANFGYLTYGFHMNQGFQYYDQRLRAPLFGEKRPYYLSQGIRNILIRFFSSAYFELFYRRAESINNEVFALLNKLEPYEAPFFLFINYMDAHEPYSPVFPYDTLYPGKMKRRFTTADYRTLYRKVNMLEKIVSEEERDHLISQYDGEIAYLDFHVGKLISRLKQLDLYKNTLIIITSDHGEAFGERNLMEHALSVYQDQISIPLIIKYPHIQEGRVVVELSISVDLFPTILDVLDYSIPRFVEGRSLLEILDGKSRNVISESYPHGIWRSRQLRFDRIERAIFSRHYKLISSTAGKRELYDLLKDPNETKNLYSENGVISKELEMQLNHWLEATASAEKEAGAPAPLNKATLERLKSLGYVK